MSGGGKLAVSLGFALYAMGAVAPPALAPQIRFIDPSWVTDHKVIPIPMIGIRGLNAIFRLPIPS